MVMRVLDQSTRVYADTAKLDDIIGFYEKAQDLTCSYRFELSERGIKGARVGRMLVLAAEKAVLDPFRHIQEVFYVDSLDEFIPWLKANGAEILHGPNAMSHGTNITVRHPDGLVVEYFEARK